MRRIRRLREEEQALWASFVRDIKPLVSSPTATVSTEPLDPTAVPSVENTRPELPQTMGRKLSVWRPGPDQKSGTARLVMSRDAVDVGQRLPGVDSTSWNALTSGKMRAERVLDLHGHLAQAAFMRLHHFLHEARADRVRCVEVITGLGTGHEGGVIRRELPLWLGRADLRHMILAVVHPHAANKGSVRILLRRTRQSR